MAELDDGERVALLEERLGVAPGGLRPDLALEALRHGSWVYEQSRLGRIPTVPLGRYRRYRREAIEQWLLELEAGGVRESSPRRTAA